jgi:phosphatidate cytidylyltransferase
MFAPSWELLWAMATIFAALSGGTLVRFAALRGAPADVAQSRLDSLKTWWILAGLLAVALLGGKTGVLALLTVAALLGLREFVSLVGREAVGSLTIVVVFLLAAGYFVLLLAGLGEPARQAAPVVFVVALGGLRAKLGLIEGYVRSTAAMIWGLLLFVYCLSHAYLMLELPAVPAPPVGSLGWFLFLALLTETNDITQALAGRRFGKTKLTPRTSPNKSLEGLVSGMAATVLLAVVSAPSLTSLPQGRSFVTGILVSAAAGILISLFGFLGDINVSGIKRDVGVKDGSRLLPGQGGMIDRINSLTFTAPVFYYYIRIVM